MLLLYIWSDLWANIHELCSPDRLVSFSLGISGYTFHGFLSPIFWCGFLSSCVLSSGFQDPIPSPTSHSFLFRKKQEGWCLCIRLAKTSPQSLEFLALSYWPELGPGACCSVNESIKGESYPEILLPPIRLRLGYQLKGKEKKYYPWCLPSNQ